MRQLFRVILKKFIQVAKLFSANYLGHHVLIFHEKQHSFFIAKPLLLNDQTCELAKK